MSIRVLVVDDDDRIRRTLSSSLVRAGFEVTSVDDGAPAMELAANQNFDALVVDFNLKTMTGADVVRFFKARYGESMYCAVLSGEDDADTHDACVTAGANDVMMKPASPRALRDRLTEAVTEIRRIA